MFSRPDGRPLDPRADYEEFKELLREAGIDDRRLYDGSHHMAGTILNELGVDMPTIMEILRHTRISQTRRYVNGRSHLSKDPMRRMGEFLVPARQGPTESKTEAAGTARHAPAAVAASANRKTPAQTPSVLGFEWSRLRDSNPRPTHYECVALAI